MKFSITRAWAAIANLFFLTAALTIGLPAPAAADPEPAQVEEWRSAETLLLTGQPEEAYRIFGELLKKYPGHSALLLGQARSSVLSGRYHEADEIYRALLKRYPSNHVLQNESGQVKNLLTRVPSATTVNLKMRAGFIYDSNANQGSPSEYFDFGQYRFLIPEAKKIGTAAAYFGADFNIARRLSEVGRWSLVGDARFYLRGNENSDLDDIKSSEWQWFRLGGGVRYADGQNLAELRIRGEVFDYELTNHVSSWGPELLYLRAVTPATHLISQVSLDRRNYQRNHDRDGTYGQAAEYLRYFFGENSHSITLGAGFLWGLPKFDRFKYNGWFIPLRLIFKPHEKWEISPNFNYIEEKYQLPGTVLETTDRRDKKFRTGLDLVCKLTESFSLELNYSYNRNDSSSALYDYDQHTVGLGVAWGF
jgi:tetratricopeptide (TPR) repeat protein